MEPLDTQSPHDIFVLPEIEVALRRDLTILILADGNRRSPSGGYAGGARRVVSIAEHLALRDDVTTMVACILSPDNIAKRGSGFFLDLYKQFILLGAEIERHGLLVRAGVRMEVTSDLGALRARGGEAAALADAMEAVTAMTTGVDRPLLRLILGVAYGTDTVRAFDVDIVLRTGMEEPGALRLSGLDAGGRVHAEATTTLWPDIEPGEIDAVIDRAKARSGPGFAKGYEASTIEALGRALSAADLGEPVRLTIPACGPVAAVRVPVAGPHEIRVVAGTRAGGARDRGEMRSVLAPGQAPPSFALPAWLALGHANVFACEATAGGIAGGALRAIRFTSAHPPLLGRERETAPAAPRRGAMSEAARERDESADRFTEKALAWASSAGLVLPGPAFHTAAMGYLLTAFFMHYRLPTEWDPAGEAWEIRADLSAKYMVLVAVGDEGIFDWTSPGETGEEKSRRVAISSRFLEHALDDEGSSPPLPRVARAEILAAIAETWRAIFEEHRRSCHAEAAACFRRALRSHYRGELTEHRASSLDARRDDPFEDTATLAATIEDRFSAAPPSIASRAQVLAESVAGGGSPAARRELSALAYLSDAGAAIAAGFLFRTAALAAPAAGVTGEGIRALDEAAAIIDYHFRLVNDLSTFLESPRGDRDEKNNACTILVPEGLSGPARAGAVASAVAAGRRLAAWLGDEEARHVDRVAALWPSMGVVLRRGVFVGRRVYEEAHYASLGRDVMSAIFDEAERDPRMR